MATKPARRRTKASASVTAAGGKAASASARSAKRPSSGGRGRESATSRQARAAEITRRMRREYADAECALGHKSALQLLVSTILSAQCTDERVNKVTPGLFAKYGDARAFADADPAELESLIQSTGFFRNKAKSLMGTGRVLCERFGGEVPDTMDELLELPGVARKTANVILGTWFGKNVGVVVDTHIGRLATRMKLTWRSRDGKDAVKIERDLMEILPQSDWTFMGHALIQHGRSVCPARKPACGRCAVADLCPSADSFEGDGTASKPASKRAVKRTKAARKR